MSEARLPRPEVFAHHWLEAGVPDGASLDTPRVAGFKESELGRRILERIPLHRPATPDEIAWAILFLLSPLASYINGALLTVDGGRTVTQ